MWLSVFYQVARLAQRHLVGAAVEGVEHHAHNRHGACCSVCGKCSEGPSAKLSGEVEMDATYLGGKE